MKEYILVATVLYRAMEYGRRSAESRKINVLEMKCLRSFVEVSRFYRVWKEEVHRKAVIEMEQLSRVDQ